jgi:hypothetical protein
LQGHETGTQQSEAERKAKEKEKMEEKEAEEEERREAEARHTLAPSNAQREAGPQEHGGSVQRG